MDWKIAVGFGALVSLMLAIPFLLARSGARRKLRVGQAGGAVVLRMPRGHNLVLAVLASLPFAVFSAMAFLVEWQPGARVGGVVLGVLMALLAVAGGGWFVLQETRGCVRLDDEGVTRVGPLGARHAAWGEVARIDFNHVNSWFFLTLQGGGKIYVVDGMDGICDFADVVLSHLPPALLRASPDATEALRELSGMKG